MRNPKLRVIILFQLKAMNIIRMPKIIFQIERTAIRMLNGFSSVRTPAGKQSTCQFTASGDRLPAVKAMRKAI